MNYDELYETQTGRMLDCAFFTGTHDEVCEICGRVYPENLSIWRAPHENAPTSWVCSEDCAREWCELNLEIVNG